LAYKDHCMWFVVHYIRLFKVHNSLSNCNKQEAQLMLTNPRDAFRGQSRSPNVVPLYMLGIVSSCAIVTLSKTRRCSAIRLQKMSWPWNPGQRSLKVIESGTIR